MSSYSSYTEVHYESSGGGYSSVQYTSYSSTTGGYGRESHGRPPKERNQENRSSARPSRPFRPSPGRAYAPQSRPDDRDDDGGNDYPEMHTGESQRPSGTENRENGSSAKPCARELFAEAHRQLHVSVGSGYEDILSALKTKKNFIRRKYSGDDLTIRQKIAEADNAFEVLTGSRPPPTGHGYHTNTRSSGYSTRSSGYSTRSSSNSIPRKERRWTEEDEAEYQRAREREELETRKRHCETLGVKMSDGLDVIKKVYRQEALKHHPDRTGVASHSEFVRIDEAYKWLVENAEARNKLEQTTGY